ncbi:MAG: serine/threonine-protein kinase [Myxococcales bacterium]|nr:MAG: serine/threonine-protein kinase [Myxococcales bacterium]
MGVVWKALDTTLDRDVAIKILPPAFTGEPDRLARFESEARLLASLNHPNIAGIFGLHEDGGQRFLAMELVPGEDLAHRLERGPIPTAQALDIARQVAEGLEAAHDQGVIHRDLKPANVRLTPDGKAKVLDFGLAKGLDASGASDDPSTSPTITSLGTVAGVILGTAAYMSPEQARGHSSDRRADVWSFGAMFYEMLGGGRAFEGDTISDTLAAVLRVEPNWDGIRDDVPPLARRVLRRCLVKDPRRRMQSIAEVRARLEDAIADPSDAASGIGIPVTAEGDAAPVRSSRLPWIVAFIAIGALAGLLISQQLSKPNPPLVLRSEIGMSAPVSDVGGANLHMLSDGHRILFAGGEARQRQLWLRDLSEIESRAFAGTDGAILGTVSPDEQWFAFFADNQLRKISVNGGAPISIADVTVNPRGASWSDDGYIYFAPGTYHEILRVPEDGGEPETMSRLDIEAAQVTRVNSHRWPTILPGNRALLYLAGNAGDFADARIEVRDLESGAVQVLHQDALFPRYLNTGHIAFINEGALNVMGFDVETLTVTSPPNAIVDGVMHSFGNGGAQYSVSDNGTLVYLPGGGLQVEIEMLEVAPGETPVKLAGPGALFHPRYSPDGKLIAYTDGLGVLSDIWIYDTERGIHTRLTLDSSAMDGTAVWSPDGKSITFSSNRDGRARNLYRRPTDGSGAAVRLTESDQGQVPTSWSPDGRMLLFMESTVDNSFDIALLRFDENGAQVGERELIVSSPADDVHAVFSPDGQFIAYGSRESGEDQVYLRTVAGSGRWQISDDSGIAPRWGRDGKRIYYQSSAGEEIKVVDFSVRDGAPVIGRPRTALEQRVAFVQTISATFDIDPADETIVIMGSMFDRGDRPNPILIQKWTDELE